MLRHLIIFTGLLTITTLQVIGQAGNKTLKPADLVVHNGKIHSGPGMSEYTTMIIRGGKVIELSNDLFWKTKYKPVEVLDLGGKHVFPGFIDAHCHFLGLGKALDEVNLYGTRSMNEVADRVSLFIKAHPGRTWIQGRGWDQNDWDRKEFPDNHLLDSLFPGKYIVLSRIDGHAILASNSALAYAGIKPGTEVDGGKILESSGKLTGVLVDMATELLRSKMPAPDLKTRVGWLKAAQEECLKNGLTQVADAGLPVEDILLIDSLCRNKVLTMRFYLMGNAEEKTFRYIRENGALINDHVRFQSLKIYADGALGSRGALLRKPYCDDLGNYGLRLVGGTTLDSILDFAMKWGFQANTHCIGDSANHFVLQAYGKALVNAGNDRRWRIEHAQVVDPEDRRLFKTFSIIPSVQPTHATSDMYWAESRLCDSRMEGAYSYRSLLENSQYLALGTDFPVEYVSPFLTIMAARFRQDIKGYPADGFIPNESLTGEQTFAGMTQWAARANFWEESTGVLEPGKMADFIVLEKDPFEATLDELGKMLVWGTYIDGKRRR